jgi:DnaJ-class molecular chaperone
MVGREKQDVAMILLEPDGYYTFLGVSKPTTTVAIEGKEPSTDASSIDEETIKKNYRKWSLKFHPDKGGDAEAFRLLNRAQKVLMNPKLRQQYNILGIDLDDDEEHHNEDKDGKEISSSQSIVQEIASNVLTGVIQVGVRTRK